MRKLLYCEEKKYKKRQKKNEIKERSKIMEYEKK